MTDYPNKETDYTICKEWNRICDIIKTENVYLYLIGQQSCPTVPRGHALRDALWV